MKQGKQNNFLVIEHTNARSLLASMSEIRLLVINRNIDILCVSETWLLPRTPDNYIHIPDYNVYRCDKNYGGGVCVYVKNCLATNEIATSDDRPNGVEHKNIATLGDCNRLDGLLKAASDSPHYPPPIPVHAATEPTLKTKQTQSSSKFHPTTTSRPDLCSYRAYS